MGDNTRSKYKRDGRDRISKIEFVERIGFNIRRNDELQMIFFRSGLLGTLKDVKFLNEKRLDFIYKNYKIHPTVISNLCKHDKYMRNKFYNLAILMSRNKTYGDVDSFIKKEIVPHIHVN